MNSPLFPRLCAALRCALFLAGLALPAWAAAQEPHAAATLSPSAVELGETARLSIDVVGSRDTGEAPEVKVDGLEIHYVGPSTQESVSYSFGGPSSGVNRIKVTSHVYEIVPKRAGSFTIPAVTLSVDGRTVRTRPVSLAVAAGTPRAGANGAAASTLDPEPHPEIVLGKTSVYVGEAVPVELQLRVDARINWEFRGPPSFEGEGFTKSKPTAQRPEQATRDGRTYDVGIFRSTITPSRAGTVQVGPAEFVFRAQAPRAQRARPRSPFADSFFDNFFDEQRGAWGPIREFEVKANPVALTVKPLPSAGRPANFSGAVGQFQLSATGVPARAKIGDPFTLKLVLTGSGSFDRVTAPALKDPTGWRSYPPTEAYQADDEFGLRATKSFEIAMIPEARLTQAPVFEFSYFDPTAGKYVTLQTKPEPLSVTGEPLPPPAPPAAASPGAPSPAVAKPAPAATDILGLRYDAGPAASSVPLYRQPGFLAAQVLPAALLLGWLLSRLRRPDPAARQVARWRREREDLLAQLRREQARQPFFETAVRVLQLDGAVRTGRAPELQDAAALRHLHPGRPVIDEIFAERSAVLFAGGGPVEDVLAGEDRERLRREVGEVARAS